MWNFLRKGFEILVSNILCDTRYDREVCVVMFQFCLVVFSTPIYFLTHLTGFTLRLLHSMDKYIGYFLVHKTKGLLQDNEKKLNFVVN